MGRRIKDVVSQQTTFNPNLKLLVDHDSFTLTSKAMTLGLLGNTYIQGSSDGINYHDILLITDTTFRMSTNAGVTWINLTTDLVTATAGNMYLSPALLAEIQASTIANHSHSNSTLLNSLISSGDGASFLANDGTYKSVMRASVYDTNNSGVVDNAEELNGEEASFYLSRDNHTGIIYNQSKSVSIKFPTDLEDMSVFYTGVAITITAIQALVKGTTPSMTIDVFHTLDRTVVENSIFNNPVIVTNTTSGMLQPADNGVIPIGSWIVIKTTARVGTVDELSVTILYDIN